MQCVYQLPDFVVQGVALQQVAVLFRFRLVNINTQITTTQLFTLSQDTTTRTAVSTQEHAVQDVARLMVTVQFQTQHVTTNTTTSSLTRLNTPILGITTPTVDLQQGPVHLDVVIAMDIVLLPSPTVSIPTMISIPTVPNTPSLTIQQKPLQEEPLLVPLLVESLVLSLSSESSSGTKKNKLPRLFKWLK